MKINLKIFHLMLISSLFKYYNLLVLLNSLPINHREHKNFLKISKEDHNNEKTYKLK